MDKFQTELLAVLTRIADSLQKAPVPERTAPAEPEAPVPSIGLEEVRAILAEKSRAGHTAQIQKLLEKYGASKLSKVDPTHYRDLLNDAEALK